MDDLYKIANLAFKRYYATLSDLGYNDNQYSLIILFIILKSLDYFSNFITDEDVDTIYNSLHCLENCLIIPYRNNYNYDTIIHDILTSVRIADLPENPIRVTEFSDIRVIE